MGATKVAHEEEKVLQYLLGGLDEARSVELEERIFLEDDYYQFVLGIEEQMVRDYVAGVLPADARASFEGHYLASLGNAEKVAFARALREAGMARFPRGEGPSGAPAGGFWVAMRTAFAVQSRGFRWAATVVTSVVLLTMCGLAGLALAEREAVLAERARSAAARQGLAAENHRLAMELRSATGEAAFLLAPVNRTGDSEASTRLLLSPGTSRLVLNLELSAAATTYAGFQAAIDDVDARRSVWSGDLAKAAPTAAGRWQVTLVLDCRQIPDGDYSVALAGVRPAGTLERLPSFSFSLRRASPPPR